MHRYRVPYHEAVVLELEEIGYEYAANYFKMLFNFDEEMRIKIGPGTVIWSNPRLRERDEFLDRLKIGLVKANKAIIEGRIRLKDKSAEAIEVEIFIFLIQNSASRMQLL